MEFTTKIEDTYNISIWKLAQHLGIKELEDINANFTIKWSAEIEAREWGIKDIYTIIHSVSGVIEYSHYADDDLEGNDPLIEKEFEFTGDGFEIKDNEFKFKNGMLEPNDIEVDFERKTITIS